MREFLEWDRRTAALLEDAYVAAGAGPGGSGSGELSEGAWRAKRQHLAVPMDEDGTWLDVGCANGHLLATLPGWAAERGVTIEPHGLELLARVAELARALHPQLARSIWTGSVMSWTPPARFRYVTVLDDAVPPDRLDPLVARLLDDSVAPGGRLIISSYTNAGQPSRRLFEELRAAGRPPDGIIHIDRPREPGQPEVYEVTADLHERDASDHPAWGLPPTPGEFIAAAEAAASSITELERVHGRTDDVSSSDDLFERPILRWCRQTQHFDARGFVGLLRTYSLYGSLPDHVREPLLAGIEERIRTRMGDHARRDYLVAVRLARRAR